MARQSRRRTRQRGCVPTQRTPPEETHAKALLPGRHRRLDQHADHEPPHFHARHGGDEIRVEIGTLNVMTGQLTPAKQRKLLRWAAAHNAELLRNWYRARQGLPHEPIAPTMEEG
ncbi:MAG TPA: DUF4160 domain-containing protein [Dermatophilaceae bacterium]|nr:DUF4160 domain-containing protein [Dermatophilaceae bacterium]